MRRAVREVQKEREGRTGRSSPPAFSALRDEEFLRLIPAPLFLTAFSAEGGLCGGGEEQSVVSVLLLDVCRCCCSLLPTLSPERHGGRPSLESSSDCGHEGCCNGVSVLCVRRRVAHCA